MNPTKQNNNYDVKAGLATIENNFTICGVSIITHNKDGRAAEDINALWEKFFADNIGQKLNNRKDDTIYAVYSDYQGDHNDPYRLTIGYRTDDSDHDTSLETVHVTHGEYAALSAQGQQPQALLQTWEAIWSSDLNRTLKTDFEVYGPRFFEDGIHEVLIYLGVKS